MTREYFYFTHLGMPCKVQHVKWGPSIAQVELGAAFLTEHYCGYVGVDNKHPLYAKDGDDVRVFGGMTYSAKEEDGLWWLGFDTAHPYHGRNKNELWTKEETIEETKYLAEQLSQWNLMNLLK